MKKKPEKYLVKQEVEALIGLAYKNKLPLAAKFLGDQWEKPTKEDYVELCKMKRKQLETIKDNSNLLEFSDGALTSTFDIYIFWEMVEKDHISILRGIASTKEGAENMRFGLEREFKFRKTKNTIYMEKNIANHSFGASQFTPENLKFYQMQERDGD